MTQNNMLDCRGLACPEPVVRSKKYIQAERPASFAVLVDNQAAMENVSRLLRSQGYGVKAVAAGQDWRVEAERTEGVAAAANSTVVSSSGAGTACPDGDCALEKVCVVISSPVFGSGDDELGSKLMKNFLATLPEFGKSLWRVILLNGGVKLAAKNSPVLEQLAGLEKDGADILVCGTCLEHFLLMQDKAIGETTNMMDVVTSMQIADKVLKL